MKEYLMFGLKVAAVILVIQQIGPLQQVVYKNYFAG